ncbi:Golgi apparatus protein 1 [Lycorma delicatula]|uniref:Golgi apparatus protein 1 n=1 Tax=Lycorma delicatula TaxID=130591 RepID=UPI003F51682E
MEIINVILVLLVNLIVDNIVADDMYMPKKKISAGLNLVDDVNETSNKLLINNQFCKNSFSKLCSSLTQYSDDLTVLECIQSYKIDVVSNLDIYCQNAIWSHTANLMKYDHLSAIIGSVCSDDDLEMLKKNCLELEEHSHYLSCILDKYNLIKNIKCHNLIHRIGLAAFSDFRLISDLTKYCENNIKDLKCGRMQPNNELMTLSQGHTINCLQQKIERLEEKCKEQVLHFSELQANDIKFDRQLYIACSEETQRFCQNVKPGTGQMYKCLMQHKMDRSMSEKCESQLLKHQKLISQDYRASKGLARACKEYIRNFHCRRSVSDDKAVRLAQILLCLENNLKNGSKVSHDCQSEMIEHRKFLLEDYRLSPEIVAYCSGDISQFCQGNIEIGKTIHCLLEHSRYKRKKPRVSFTCQRALEQLIKETDAGEYWQVDPVLNEACRRVVDIACQKVHGGEARVITCLMDHIGTALMTDACETALLQIQYFIARDYKLDPQLYKQCHEDAVHYCHAKHSWHDETSMDPDLGPLVLPCLYRIVYLGHDSIRLKPGCNDEIHRVMRVRAISVDLQPEIEIVCVNDLAVFCSDKTGVGEEMVCLQDNLESLSQDCKNQVSNFTQVESANIELNPIVLATCQIIIEKHCEAEFQAKDAGNVMDCLIEKKNEPDVRAQYKCRAAVEHFQLITLKDYHFTVKFEKACRNAVLRFCPKAKTKADVVYCLSEHIRNDTITEVRHNIPKECRQQLKFQLLQQRENINLDPKLSKACQNDIPKHCGENVPGNSAILECLRLKKKELSPECHRHIFAIELHDLADSSSDYALLNGCKQMIMVYCSHTDLSQVLPCLKKYKDEPQFDQRCKKVVIHRMIEQSTDYRLNPALQNGCKIEIRKYCFDVINKESPNMELEGKVIKCLQLKFIKRKLSLECEQQMSIVLREAALNYQLIPVLRTVCEYDIKETCSNTDESLGSGAVLECLKVALLNNKIRRRECQVEVAGLIEEAKADIHVDPLLLRACSVDIIKFCNDIPQGAGRHIQCLTAVLSDSDKTRFLQSDCETMLKQRMDMFKNADKLILTAPNSLGDLYGQVQNSPSRKYFTVVAITFIGMIFITGLFCGRITRRTTQMKNK